MAVLNKQLQEECKQLIHKYQSYKSEWRKVKCRNELYLKMKEDLLKWTSSTISRWGKHESQQKLLSMSWDIFVYCLNGYKDGSDLVMTHFHNYTKYWLLDHYAKKGSVHLPLDEFRWTIGLMKSPENIAWENMMTLFQFREVIPDKCKKVWDDCVQSLCPVSKERKWDWVSGQGMTKNTYEDLRSVLIPIIKKVMGLENLKNRLAKKEEE